MLKSVIESTLDMNATASDCSTTMLVQLLFAGKTITRSAAMMLYATRLPASGRRGLKINKITNIDSRTQQQIYARCI